jgi:hypothetical protein
MARELELVKYLAMVRALERRFKGFTLKHIPRSQNIEVDELAKVVANNLPTPKGTFYQVLRSPTTKIASEACQMVLLIERVDWRQAITDTLHNVFNLEDEANATRMVARARSYTLIEGTLYKKRGGTTAAQMHIIGRRQGTPTRNTLRHMRLAHKPKGIDSEGHQIGFLLAYTYQGHRANS